MPFLNHFANQAFSWLFSWLLNQRFADTRTKVLSKRHYEQIAANWSYFGDFDLIFGAAELNLKIIAAR